MGANSPTVNELLQNVQQLNAADFEEFLNKILAIRGRKALPKLSADETKLLEKIKTGLPRAEKQRLDYLIARRDLEEISPEEYQELLTLTELLESYELRRLQTMTQLADLQNMSLPEVLEAYNLSQA